MNRYHLGFLFAMTALILFSTISWRSERAAAQQKADRTTQAALQFAVSCASGILDADFGDTDDPGQISALFFQSLTAFEDGRSLQNGRISPEDYYPYAPALVYLRERDYALGWYDGSDYVWESSPYVWDGSDNRPVLSDVDTKLLLKYLEDEVNDKLEDYHDKCNLPEKEYTLPDFAARQPNSGTLLVVLENFPTMLDGYYYSGVFDGSGAIREK